MRKKLKKENMDFNSLLKLAEDNSTFAKKKFERNFGAKTNDGVSKSAVTSFLARQAKSKEKIKAEENEARRKRIEARMHANRGKKATSNATKQSQIKNDSEKKKISEEKTKFKIDDNFKKNEEQHNKKNCDTQKTKHGDRHNTNHSEHKEEKLKSEKERHKIENDKQNKKVKQKSNNSAASALSFAELAKLARDNASTAGHSKDSTKMKNPSPKLNDKAFDPDRDIRIKRKPQEKPLSQQTRNANLKQEKYKSSKKSNQKEVSASKHSDEIDKREKTLNEREKELERREKQLALDKRKLEKGKPSKHGLIAETISETWKPDSNGNKFKNARDVNRSRGSGERGIAAQNSTACTSNKNIYKRSARDYDDDFEKEERMFAKRRRMFEMKRITGNQDLDDEDYDEYDLDEENDSDLDFIDDTEPVGNHYSKYIAKITGYNRDGYMDPNDDDLSDMEVSYSQIQKEEARSARVAKIEDDYERMKEEEEMKRINDKKKKR